MKSKLSRLFKSLLSKISISAKRFPEAILCALTASVLAIILNRNDDFFNDEVLEILKRAAMVFALLFPVSLIGANIYERIKKARFTRVIIDAAIIVFGVLYYFFLFTSFDLKQGITYFAISFAAYLLFIAIVELRSQDGFEIYTVNLAIMFFITYFYSLVLYGGISAIFLTINFLFDLNINEKIYLDTLIIIAGLFAPTFFLAKIPINDTKFELPQYSAIIRILLLYIVMPVIAIYTAILYIYLVRVIFNGLPENMIANLILWYAIITTLVIFLIYPFKNTNNWADTFTKFLPKLILPLMLMLFYSIGLRISEYGITERRYFVVVAGLWVFGSMIYLSIIKQAHNIVLPISLAVIAVLSVLGPINAFNVSRWSQNARFEQILEQNDMISNGMIIKGIDPEKKDMEQISSILRYFDSKQELGDIKLLPDGFALDNMKSTFGFSMYYEDPYIGKSRYFSFSANKESITDIKGYDYMIDLTQDFETKYYLNENDLEVSFDRGSNLLLISYLREEIFNKDLKVFLLKLHDEYPDIQFEKIIDPAELTFITDTKTAVIALKFSRIDGGYEDDELVNVYTDFVILIDIK